MGKEKPLSWDTMTRKERRKYVNQDRVAPWRIEIPTDNNLMDNNEAYTQAFVGIKIKNSKHLKELIIALHKDGKSLREIAYHLPCSFQYASLVIKGVK